MLQFSVGFQAERLALRNLTVKTNEPTGLTTAAIAVSPNDLLAAVREWIIADAEPNPELTDTREGLGIETPKAHEWWADKLAEFRKMVRQPESRARVRTPDYLREFAADYVRFASENPLGGPVEAMADWLDMTRSGVDKTAILARAEGWLAPTTRGARSGIRPGDALLRHWTEHGWPEWYPRASDATDDIPTDNEKGDN